MKRLDALGMRNIHEDTFAYACTLRSEELHSSGPSGDLRARLAGPSERDPVQIGVPALYANYVAIMEARGVDRLDLPGGMLVTRNADGGISIRTGSLQARMDAKPSDEPAPAPAPAPRETLSEAVARYCGGSSPTAKAAAQAAPSVPAVSNPFADSPYLKDLK